MREPSQHFVEAIHCQPPAIKQVIQSGSRYHTPIRSAFTQISAGARERNPDCLLLLGGFGEILHRLLVDRTWLHSIPGGKGPDHLGPGQVKQSGSTLIFGPSYSASRRAEHFFEALTEGPRPECIFWTRPAETCSSAPNVCSLEPRS